MTDLPDSQLSGLSLDLSQGTVNQLMLTAVGWNATSDSLVEEYHIAEGENPATPESGSRIIGSNHSVILGGVWPPSSSHLFATPTPAESLDFSIKRAVLLSYSQPQQGPYHDHEASLASLASLPHIPPLVQSPLYQPYSSVGSSPTSSVMPGSVQSRSSEGFVPCSQFSPSGGLRSNIPHNVSIPGDYGFRLDFTNDAKATKSVSQTYSRALKRLYVKIDTKIPFTFTFTTIPPPSFLIRATCVYKSPQMLGEVVQCCPKHLEEQKLKGVLFPQHFIRASHPHAAVYMTDPFSNHHSVCSHIQPRGDTDSTLSIIYILPCYTSELAKGGQLVQVLFTLESADGAVMGRCVTDLKVCASPGRDRANDEGKGKGSGPAADGVDGLEVNPRKRKRVSSEVVTASVSSGSKALTLGLSGERMSHTITTFPELFPYVDSMVSMLEAVYKVRVAPTGPAENESQSSTLSQATTSTTTATGQTVELLHIQVKKTTSICKS